MNTFGRDLPVLSLSPTLVFPAQCGTRMDQAESEAEQDRCGPGLRRYQQKSHRKLHTAQMLLDSP